jgi:hypothetical protein
VSLNGPKLERRLEALESAHGIGGADGCPQCGQRDHRPGDTYEVVFVDPEEDTENEWCSTCGRQTHVVLSWDDPR